MHQSFPTVLALNFHATTKKRKRKTQQNAGIFLSQTHYFVQKFNVTTMI